MEELALFIEILIVRDIQETIRKSLTAEQKIVILYGARQVGKTTLVTNLLRLEGLDVVSINADERRYHAPFSSRDLGKMIEVVGDHDTLFIDEAQQIPEIGINLKILHDAKPDLNIIVTGSSSFDLANRTQEALTGRTRTFTLFPIAISELRKKQTPFEIKENLEKYLIYGLYPEVITTTDLKIKKSHLSELTQAYLYKDILSLASIRNSDKIHKLLQLLALQIGSSVSINKLANALDLSSETVNHYIDLLEKSFVIFRRSAYSKNLSKEISKMDKIYFYDTGIRNALLENFNELSLRSDRGSLWENFIVTERMKANYYQQKLVRSYYWRVYTGAEIDLIEESEDGLQAFEIKAGSRVAKPSRTWQETYPQVAFQTINMDNWIDWIVH